MATIVIRKCRAEDSLDLLSWRNDKSTRAMSLNSELVALGEHQSWFDGKLADEHCVLFIGEVNCSKIGMVRFDVDKKMSVADVSINLNPEYRGRKMAEPLLRSCIDEFRELHTCEIHATVRCENVASNKVFQSVGFVEVSSDNDAVRYQLF